MGALTSTLLGWSAVSVILPPQFLNPNFKISNLKKISMTKIQNFKRFGH
jgi:hypothetical protein